MTAKDLPRDRDVWRIAVPMILSNLSVPLLGMVDTGVVGHLDSAVYLGAVAVGGTIFSFLYTGVNFLRMGTTGLIAQAFGRDDMDEMVVTVVRSSALALLFGLLLFALQEAVLALSLKAMAPPENVAAVTSEYFRIRIWAAPFTLLGYAIIGILFGERSFDELTWTINESVITYGTFITAFVAFVAIDQTRAGADGHQPVDDDLRTGDTGRPLQRHPAPHRVTDHATVPDTQRGDGPGDGIHRRGHANIGK